MVDNKLAGIDSGFRFIPFRRRDVVEMCLADHRLTTTESDFRQLADMLTQIFHFEFHGVLEALKDSYADLDPDVDTRRVDIGHETGQQSFVDLLDGLLEKANYERISETELNQALRESSLFKIRLHVDFSDFAEVSLFARGRCVAYRLFMETVQQFQEPENTFHAGPDPEPVFQKSG